MSGTPVSRACLALLVVSLLASTSASAAEHVVPQKNKAFAVEKLKVKVGDSVKFVNDDPFSHNVFSLSDVKSFDLGTYPKGAAKSVVFDKAGIVEVECAVHPDMRMTIEVAK
jgi:plastocyanin